MTSVAVAVLLFAQAASDPGERRPDECAGVASSNASNVWERAKHPSLRRFCELVASVSAKLAAPTIEPTTVVPLIEQAEKLRPGSPAVGQLRARVLGRQGKFAEALRQIDRVRARAARSTLDAHVLLVEADSAANTGALERALAAYDTLLPRAASLRPDDRDRVYVSTALLTMLVRPNHTARAAALLREVAHASNGAAQTIAAIGVALVLDREGQRDEARATLEPTPAAERGQAFEELRAAGWFADPITGAEALALEAESKADSDAAAARGLWRRYAVRAAAKPWVSHAEKRAGGGS